MEFIIPKKHIEGFFKRENDMYHILFSSNT